MKKKNSYLKLCLDPELEKESQKVKKGAIIFQLHLLLWQLLLLEVLFSFY